MKVQKGKKTLEVKLDGYKTETASFEHHWEWKWLLFDLLLVTPTFIIDLITGSWYGYEPDKFRFVLQPSDILKVK